jgi:RimJ/RimL family protein N-acetyltransferase
MLQIATIEDFDFLYFLYMHDSINPFLLYEVMSAADFLPVITPLLEKKQIYIFHDEATDEKIGMCKLIRYEHRNAHIGYLGGVAIRPDFMGKGFGKKIIQAALSLATSAGIKRVELSTATFNEAAITTYEKAGFQKEGILRNYTFLRSENRYIDEVMMAIWLV